MTGGTFRMASDLDDGEYEATLPEHAETGNGREQVYGDIRYAVRT